MEVLEVRRRPSAKETVDHQVADEVYATEGEEEPFGPSAEQDWLTDDFVSTGFSGPPTSASSTRPSSRMSFTEEIDNATYSRTPEDEAPMESAEIPFQAEHVFGGIRSGRSHGHAERERSYVVRQGAQTSDGEMGVVSPQDESTKRARARHDDGPSKKNKIGPMDLFLRPRRDEEQPEKCEDTVLKARRQKYRTTCEDVSESEGDESEEESHGSDGKECGASHGVTGISRAARHAQKMREARLTGNQHINERLYGKFKQKVLEWDPNARFDPKRWVVQHSTCRKDITTKSLYAPGYFIDHVHRCKTATTLHDFFGDSGPSLISSKSSPSTHIELPCSGLTAAHDSRIQTYLQRPTALGGGGKSKLTLAKQKFGKRYSKLTNRQKAEVDRLNEASWLWVVKHQHGAVFSSSCEKTVKVLNELENHENLCTACRSVLHQKTFRNAISLPEPSTANMKFINKGYRQEEIATKFLKCKGVDELLHPSVCVFSPYQSYSC